MKEEITIIANALRSAQDYLYDNLDAICDENYREETQRVLEEIEQAIVIADNLRRLYSALVKRNISLVK